MNGAFKYKDLALMIGENFCVLFLEVNCRKVNISLPNWYSKCNNQKKDYQNANVALYSCNHIR